MQYIHYGNIHTKWNSVLDCNTQEIPFIDKSKVHDLPFLREGDLVITDVSEDHVGSGVSILLTNVKNKKIVSGLHTIVIRTSNENILPDFIRYLTSIKFVKSQIVALVTGTSVFGLSKKNFRNIMVPILPLLEQTRIASILSGVDASHFVGLKSIFVRLKFTIFLTLLRVMIS